MKQADGETFRYATRDGTFEVNASVLKITNMDLDKRICIALANEYRRLGNSKNSQKFYLECVFWVEFTKDNFSVADHILLYTPLAVIVTWCKGWYLVRV